MIDYVCDVRCVPHVLRAAAMMGDVMGSVCDSTELCTWYVEL